MIKKKREFCYQSSECLQVGDLNNARKQYPEHATGAVQRNNSSLVVIRLERYRKCAHCAWILFSWKYDGYSVMNKRFGGSIRGTKGERKRRGCTIVVADRSTRSAARDYDRYYILYWREWTVQREKWKTTFTAEMTCGGRGTWRPQSFYWSSNARAPPHSTQPCHRLRRAVDGATRFPHALSPLPYAPVSVLARSLVATRSSNFTAPSDNNRENPFRTTTLPPPPLPGPKTFSFLPRLPPPLAHPSARFVSILTVLFCTLSRVCWR
jgi:hypothetical protein